MPSIAFNRAFSLTLVNEGGDRYVNHEADRGGPTRFGISMATLSGYRGQACTAVDVKNLLQGEAEAIYFSRYWLPIRADDYGNEALAASVFDCGVLTGTANAARMLQAAVGATVDGAIGPKTLAAVRAADKLEAMRTFSAAWQTYLIAIVQRDASQAQFLIGWLRRAASMQAYFFLFNR